MVAVVRWSAVGVPLLCSLAITASAHDEFPVAPRSVDHDAQCLVIARELLQRAKPPGTSGVYDSRMNRPTVRPIEWSSGKHGGQLLTLERTRDGWYSGYASVGYDPQGDPRWFIEVLGEKAADFFGFRDLGGRKMQVPNFSEFAGALEKVNTVMHREGAARLSVGFYPTPTDENVSVYRYVRRFIAEVQIPMAPSGNHLVHDLSFHTAAIFLPEELVQYKRASLKFESAFFKDLLHHYADSPEKLAAAKYYEYLSRFRNTVDVDTGTGIVNRIIAIGVSRRMSEAEKEKEYEPLLRWFTGNGLNGINPANPQAHPSRQAYLEDLLRTIELSGRAREAPLKFIRLELLRPHLEVLPIQEVHARLIDFATGYVPEPGGEPGAFFMPPGFKHRPPKTGEDFLALQSANLKFLCEAVNGQRLRVIRAIETLSRGSR